MKTSIRLLDLIKDSSIMSTIWKQELQSTTDWETLSNLFYAYRSVVEEMFANKSTCSTCVADFTFARVRTVGVSFSKVTRLTSPDPISHPKNPLSVAKRCDTAGATFPSGLETIIGRHMSGLESRSSMGLGISSFVGASDW